MNQLSLRNNRLKFKASWKLPIIVEESIEHPSNWVRKNWKLTTYNWLDLETLGFWPIMPKIFPRRCSKQQVTHNTIFSAIKMKRATSTVGVQTGLIQDSLSHAEHIVVFLICSNRLGVNGSMTLLSTCDLIWWLSTFSCIICPPLGATGWKATLNLVEDDF